MEDLNDKIARLLADPDSMTKIRAMMATLGGDTAAEPTAPVSPAAPAASSPASATPAVTEPLLPAGLPDLSMLTKLAPLMGAFGKEDDDTRLLQALRPYLHGEREQRLDETMQLLRLTKLLPLLQEQGVLKGG